MQHNKWNRRKSAKENCDKNSKPTTQHDETLRLATTTHCRHVQLPHGQQLSHRCLRV